MSALDLYEQMLLGEEMKAVAQRAVVLAGHPEDTDFDDVIDHEDHPALVEALREWWRGLASVTDVECVVVDYGDERSCELAIVLCAESVAHLTRIDPCFAECRRVRLAWVSMEATDKERSAAIAASLRAQDADVCAGLAATRMSLCDAVDAAAWAAADAAIFRTLSRKSDEWNSVLGAAMSVLASLLRILYPDPTRLDWRDALTRWDIAVAEAQQLMKSIADGELR